MGENTSGPALSGRKVVERLLANRDEWLIVTGLGSSSRYCQLVDDNHLNFYLSGGMGSAALIGLGLALAQPKRRVVVFTGDGELLMGLGGLPTIAVQNPPNLAIIVLDNERYGETGMQLTHTAHEVDLAGIAAASGIPNSRTVRQAGELEELSRQMESDTGLMFANVKVTQEKAVPVKMMTRDGSYFKTRFREALQT